MEVARQRPVGARFIEGPPRLACDGRFAPWRSSSWKLGADKEEKKVIGSAVDKMMAENNNGPVYVNLPDGSVCKIEIIKGGHGQSFSKDKDKPDDIGRKHRKVSFGRPAPTDDSDSEVCGDETDTTAANPMDQTKTC